MANPLKLSLKTELLPLLLVITAFVIGFYFYHDFPAVVTSHWNWAGQPNGYMGRAGGAFTLPLMLAGLYLLLTFLPYIDPRAERYQSFSGIYLMFRNLILLTLLVVFVATGLYNLGYDVKIQYLTPVIVGLLFLVLGNYMGKIKSNWFVGIRNPWTLSNEDVWNKTHRLGGWMFMLFGLLMVISPLLPEALGLTAFIVGLVLVVAATNVYSYLLYRKAS